MKLLTLPSTISLTTILVSALLQAPTSVAEETRGPKELALNTHDAHATGPGEAAEETLMIQFVSDQASPAPTSPGEAPEDTLMIIDEAAEETLMIQFVSDKASPAPSSPGEAPEDTLMIIDEAAEETIMIQFASDEALPAQAEQKIKVIRAGSINVMDSAAIQRLLPPEVMTAQHDRLNQRNALTDMNVDIIVNDQAGQHVVLGDFNHSKPGMGHRMRSNPGLRWIETAPLNEPTQLNAKAAACILKSLTKVTTESGTRLLREACQAAYPDN
jgi:hypothetical protein